MDLSTTYLGLRLAHPFMMGASPLAWTLDGVRRVEDGGAAAIVLPSLFEEQVTMAGSGTIHHMDPLDPQFADTLAGFPSSEAYVFGPDEYLEHLRRAKESVGVPIIASLNGTTSESWLKFAGQMTSAGADALELNMYRIAADPDSSSLAIETELRDLVVDLKRSLTIPLAVKLSPYFTAFGNFCRRLTSAGADGLVLFNRFYQADIDVAGLTAVPRLELSTSAELRLRLQWVAILHDRIQASLAITGGVAMPVDGVKAVLAGADAVQLVSAILRHGPAYFRVMQNGLVRWMDAKAMMTLSEVRGRVSVARGLNPERVSRANYIRTLQSWSES